MTTFRPGQRVRIKWSEAWPELANQQATVEGSCNGFDKKIGMFYPGYLVAPDCWGSPSAPEGCHTVGLFVPHPVQLEPLMEEDGRTVTSWKDCLWRPDMSHLWIPDNDFAAREEIEPA